MVYAPSIYGLAGNHAELVSIVAASLRKARLWEEVKDGLYRPRGPDLPGGQQQRLCVAHSLATDPDVFRVDEPTGSIDPSATAKIEELMIALRSAHSIVVVTHWMMEACRIADRVAYFHLGRLLEVGPTQYVFPRMRSMTWFAASLPASSSEFGRRSGKEHIPSRCARNE